MRVLGFGTYDAARHPRVGIILDGLRAAGDEVIEINEPLGIDTAERVAMLGRPWLVHRLVRRILGCWWRLARRLRAAGGAASCDVVVVGYLGHFDVLLARLLLRRRFIVLDQLVFAADTARDRGARARAVLRLLGWLDQLAASCADVVLVDTDENAALLSRRQRPKALVAAVGAPSSWFEAGRPRRAPDAGAPLRVLFFGLFTPLQGAEVIGRALAQLANAAADIEITLAGRGQDYDRTRELASANPRVRWIEWIPPDQLPALAATYDVCLGIFGRTPKALRVVPNKVFQGAAAGCAIVTSDTPPQRRFLGDAAIFVPPGDADALATALSQLAADRALVAELGARAQALAVRDFTAQAVVVGLRHRLLDELRASP